MTQERSTPTGCRISTLFAEDSLASRTLLQASDVGSMTPEELSSLRSQGLPLLKDLSICCLKMFLDCGLSFAQTVHRQRQDICGHPRYAG